MYLLSFEIHPDLDLPPDLTCFSDIPPPNGLGTIPDCIGSKLTGLQYLELNNNKLTGTIPQSLCLIGDSLTVSLFLYSNHLKGSSFPLLFFPSECCRYAFHSFSSFFRLIPAHFFIR